MFNLDLYNENLNYGMFGEAFDKFREECGIFGIYNRRGDNNEIGRTAYFGLYALQHRGQESCGIAVGTDSQIVYHKDMGLVPEVFGEDVLRCLKGRMAIGHVRYSTTGASLRENAQPLVMSYSAGQIALAHNGNLVNTVKLRRILEEKGDIFQTTIDTEVILKLLFRYYSSGLEIHESLIRLMHDIKGSYALVMLISGYLVGVRDPYGIRPLCLGKIEEETYVLASESCALDVVNAKFLRDIEPGEIIIIGQEGIKSFNCGQMVDTKLCVFEYVYFARPDSIIDGSSVYNARIEAGRRLAIEHPVEADLVIGVPDSGVIPAIGYSMESGIPYGNGLFKNTYVGRTFIQPNQKQRDSSVRVKFNPLRSEIEGKRIIMIDDSIVRGTTTRRIVRMLKSAGAKEVHVRISSPPVKYPCHFGIDTPSRNQLVASTSPTEDIRRMIEADSLGYLSIEGLLKTPVGVRCGLCTGCFDGRYPIEITNNNIQETENNIEMT